MRRNRAFNNNRASFSFTLINGRCLLVAEYVPIEQKLNIEQNEKPRILIVDDEEDICDFMKTFLENKGFNVDIAFRGYEAFLKIIEINYAAIISNIKMPGMNGIELLKMAKMLRKDLIFIIQTACHDLEEEALKWGAAAFVKKPVILDELQHTVRRLVCK